LTVDDAVVLFHVYVLAPATVNDWNDCSQIVGVAGVIVSTGSVLVVTATVRVPGHPAALVAFTVYTVDTVGVSVAVEPVTVPFHV
jgi:hypothetical protein